jgi:hypothetical protein
MPLIIVAMADIAPLTLGSQARVLEVAHGALDGLPWQEPQSTFFLFHERHHVLNTGRYVPGVHFGDLKLARK